MAADGSIKCWGNNSALQLGENVGPYSSNPIDMAVDTATAISAGKRHTCSLSPDGAVFCWGANELGQLGDGTQAATVGPVRVCDSGSGASCPPLTGVVAISVGGAFSCALLEDGTVRCWGDNNAGQLADGSDGELRPNPTPVCAHDPNSTCNATPGCVAPLSDVIAIESGSEHSCALRSDGSIVCWGATYSGQLGSGYAFGVRPCSPTAGVCLPGSGPCNSAYLESTFALQTCDVVTVSVP